MWSWHPSMNRMWLTSPSYCNVGWRRCFKVLQKQVWQQEGRQSTEIIIIKKHKFILQECSTSLVCSQSPQHRSPPLNGCWCSVSLWEACCLLVRTPDCLPIMHQHSCMAPREGWWWRASQKPSMRGPQRPKVGVCLERWGAWPGCSSIKGPWRQGIITPAWAGAWTWLSPLDNLKG